MQKKIYSILIFMVLVGVSPTRADSDSLFHLYPYTYFQTDFLMEWDTGWTSHGNQVSVPFIQTGKEEMKLSYSFSLDCFPEDSLYIFMEGVSGQGEVRVNGYFFDVHTQPFEPWIVPIPLSLLHETGNVVELTLTSRNISPGQKRAPLSIFRPVYLLDKYQVKEVSRPLMEKIVSADTVGVFMPYYRSTGWIFDEYEASLTLLPMLRQGIHAIYFPMEPGRKARAFCAQLGFKEVSILEEDTYVAYLNAFSGDMAEVDPRNLAWREMNGNRTPSYGHYQLYGKENPLEIGKTSSFLLIVMILFPLLSLFLIKILSPGFYSMLGGILIRPKLFIENFADSTYTQQGLLVGLMTLKIILSAIFLSLAVYYIKALGGWDMMSVIKDWGLAHRVYFGVSTLWGFLWRSLMVVMGVMLLEYFFIGLMATIFRIKGLSRGMMSLDAMGTFPLIWLLPLPIAFAFYMNFPGKVLFLTILAILLLVYILRRIWISYLGLGRLFSFSSPVKILYICTFNILPYLIWF